jgi:hypothetical protein
LSYYSIVHVLANEPYEGEVVGYMDYYFSEDGPKYDKEVKLPVSAKLAQPPPEPIPVAPFPLLGGKTFDGLCR